MPSRKDAATTVKLMSEPDRHVETADEQHVQLGHRDQGERRGRQQHVPPVERGEEGIGLTGRVGADQDDQKEEEAERRPPLIAGEREPPDISHESEACGRFGRRRGRSGGFRRSSHTRRQERRNDVLLAHLVAHQLLDEVSAREHQHPIAETRELQRVRRIDDEGGAAVGLGPDRLINIEARGRIHALGRLVDQHNPGAMQEAPRQHALLLIAARKGDDGLIEGCGDDVEFFDHLARARPLPTTRDHACGRKVLKNLDRDVLAHAHGRIDGLDRPVAAQHHHAGAERALRRDEGNAPALAGEGAGSVLESPNGAKHLALPVALGTGEAEDLAPVNLEGNIAERVAGERLHREADLAR